jgi:hypothetical protein
MALDAKLQERIEALAGELSHALYGPKGYAPWGTKFADLEEQTGEVGDALACAMLSHNLRQQAEKEGHPAGKCGGCGEPIPLEEITGRLLQAKRGEAAWQESYGRCQRCRKAFFPTLPGFGNQAR